jgi:hypothetical protein
MTFSRKTERARLEQGSSERAFGMRGSARPLLTFEDTTRLLVDPESARLDADH